MTSVGEFECGHYCETRTLEVGVTAVSSLPLLVYVVYLVRTKSKTRVLQMVRLYMTIFAVTRIISVVVPSGVLYTALFVSPRQMSMFLGVFEWQKSVVSLSYASVKLSKETPKWIWWYTRVHQAVCALIFPLTYSLGASPSGNPRCDAVQALNSSYRWIAGLSVAFSLIFCLYAVHRQVASITKEYGDAQGSKKVATYKQALKKIRRICIFIIVVAIITSYSFFSGVLAPGEPKVQCGSTFSAVFGPLSGALAGFLVLWSTSVTPGGTKSGKSSSTSLSPVKGFDTVSTPSSVVSPTHSRAKLVKSPRGAHASQNHIRVNVASAESPCPTPGARGSDETLARVPESEITPQVAENSESAEMEGKKNTAFTFQKEA